MKASESHKYIQLRWLYSALSGLCAAYFLALFSGDANLKSSIFLQLATLFFAICLPIFSTLAFAHVYMYEIDMPVEICDEIINEPWVILVSLVALFCLLSAFVFLIGYFSICAMVGFIIVSALCARGLMKLVKELDRKRKNRRQ